VNIALGDGCSLPGLATVFHWPIVKPSLKKRDKEKVRKPLLLSHKFLISISTFQNVFLSRPRTAVFIFAGPNNLSSLADRQTQLEKREREVCQPLLLSHTSISLSTFL